MKLAIIGATGLVGRKMLELIEELNIPFNHLLLAASKNSVGKNVKVNHKNYILTDIQTLLNQNPDIALFSAGSEISLKWATLFAKKNCYVIDNSSAFRMKKDHLLIVPEINGKLIKEGINKVIANPNCSTIQLALVLNALENNYKINKVIVSTYQSVTGSGVGAIEQLNKEVGGDYSKKLYPHPIFKNCIPHCDVFLDNNFTKEEIKLMSETKKILAKEFFINATAVRVPVVGGHSESVYVEFSSEVELPTILKSLKNAKGITLQDNPKKNIYPMPISSEGKNEVFVGRIRKDIHDNKALNLWIVTDNLRKGAATNSVQIIQTLLKTKLVKS